MYRPNMSEKFKTVVLKLSFFMIRSRLAAVKQFNKIDAQYVAYKTLFTVHCPRVVV